MVKNMNRLNLTVSFDDSGVFVATETQETLWMHRPVSVQLTLTRYDNGTCYCRFGCTDPSSCNYTYLANTDDGSCADCDLCGVCAAMDCLAQDCTDPLACNYDPDATIDDGSCEYESCAGCLDTNACNYDPAATIDCG